MTRDLSIRPYGSKDRDAVLALVTALNAHEQTLRGNRDLGTKAMSAHLDRLLGAVRQTNGAFLIADWRGSVAGYMALVCERRGRNVHEDQREYVHVREMIVDEAFRRKGIAHALLDQAEAYARRRGMTQLDISYLQGNEGARETYERWGFEPIGVEMTKRLT